MILTILNGKKKEKRRNACISWADLMLLILADSGLSSMLTKVTSNPLGPRATLGGPSTAYHYLGCRSPFSVMKVGYGTCPEVPLQKPTCSSSPVFTRYLLFRNKSEI